MQCVQAHGFWDHVSLAVHMWSVCDHKVYHICSAYYAPVLFILTCAYVQYICILYPSQWYTIYYSLILLYVQYNSKLCPYRWCAIYYIYWYCFKFSTLVQYALPRLGILKKGPVPWGGLTHLIINYLVNTLSYHILHGTQFEPYKPHND